MTPIFLIHDLAEEIKKVVSDYDLIAELQPMKHVTVYEQFIPTDQFEVDTFYPLVTVTLFQVEVVERFRVATMFITIGVYDGDREDGWRDLFNIAERISQHLISTPILANKFPLDTYPVFEPQLESPTPFYYGNIVVKYQVATPQI